MSEKQNTQEQDKTPGIFSWNELMTPDAEGSSKFYSELFGWKMESMDMGQDTYHMFKAGSRPAAGMMAITPEMGGVPPHWMGYVTVEDIASAVEKAKSLGATIRKDVTELPMGKFAVIEDPQGAGISLWEHGEECSS